MKLIKTLFLYFSALSFAFILSASGCNKKSSGSNPTPPPPPPPPASNDVDLWMTTADQSVLLNKQSTILSFGTNNNSFPFIDIDTTQIFQTIDGFGYTLTGGSALVINNMSPNNRAALLRELFSRDDNAIGVSYLRISIGASDLSPSVYTYNDMPAGQTDVNLTNFSLNPDRTHLIPVLKEILQINPDIKILASPWTAPVWMKDNNSSVGGNLQPQYYNVYAKYFVKYIQQMKAEGITVHAITPQNEPLHAGNNPSMHMTAAEQKDFIKNHLGPAFQTGGITTKIIIYDHNCDRPDYPLEILNDPAAKAFIDGSAFHLYAGNISAMGQVYNAHPDRNVYFTEQYTAANGNFGGDLAWHMKNVIVGSMRNWSKIALEWNLANDPSFGPYTPGGCNTCKGALTIGSNTVTRNVAYYIIAHVSKFVSPGSVRIGSNNFSGLTNVAFKTPAGKKVLVVLNEGSNMASFNIRFNGKWVTTQLTGGAVGTFVF